jgi:hypothetical protein
MEFVILKESSEEFGYMWDMLRLHPINGGLDEPCIALNEGEVWQYMGTYRNGDILISDFRHRCHPYSQELATATFPHVLIHEESIHSSSRIK